MKGERPLSAQQFDLKGLLGATAFVSLALAIVRLDEPLNLLVAGFVGALACAWLSHSYWEKIGLAMYGAIGGVWVASLGGVLFHPAQEWNWGVALAASWMCVPLGPCVGLVVACFSARHGRHQQIEQRLDAMRKPNTLTPFWSDSDDAAVH